MNECKCDYCQNDAGFSEIFNDGEKWVSVSHYGSTKYDMDKYVFADSTSLKTGNCCDDCLTILIAKNSGTQDKTFGYFDAWLD